MRSSEETLVYSFSFFSSPLAPELKVEVGCESQTKLPPPPILSNFYCHSGEMTSHEAIIRWNQMSYLKVNESNWKNIDTVHMLLGEVLQNRKGGFIWLSSGQL